MSDQPSVWIVDDDASIRWVLEKALSKAGCRITAFDNASDVLRQVQSDNPDIIITDIRMPGIDGLELFRYLNDQRPSLPVIVMTAHPDLKDALSAYRPVAFEYLAKPFDLDEAVGLVENEELHLRETELALLHQVLHAPRRAAHDVDALLECVCAFAW